MYKILWKLDGRCGHIIFNDRMKAIVEAGWMEAKGYKVFIEGVDG